MLERSSRPLGEQSTVISLDRQLRGLEAFSWQLNSSLALDTVLEVLAEGVEQLLEADRCAIFLKDAKTERVQCVLARRLSADYTRAVEGQYLALPGGTLLVERAQWIDDALQDPRMVSIHELVKREGFRTMLLVSLRHQDTALGAFVAYYDRVLSFDDQLLFLAQTLGNQAAVAITNAQSYEAAQLRLAELEKLRQAAIEINGQRDLQSTLDAISRHAVDMLGVQCAYVYLFDPIRRQLEVRAGCNVPPSHIGRRMSLGEGLAGQVFLSGEPMIVADHSTWENASPVWKDVDFGTILEVPLIYRQDTFGVLAFVHRSRHQTFDVDALAAAGLFAHQAAAALASALALAGSRRRADHLMALQRVSTAVMASLEVQDLLQLVVDELQRTFDFTLTSILRKEGDRLVSLATAVVGGRFSGRGDLDLSQGIIGRAARTGQPQYVSDVSRDSDFVSIVPSVGVEACVPVMLDGAVWGVLNVEALNSSALAPSDVPLLETLSQQISLAISNARLVEALQRRIDETERLKNFNEDLLRGVEAGILLERDDDRIEFVNPRLCEMVGHSADELIGQPTAMLLSPAMDAYVDRQAAGRRLGEKGRYEAALLHRDGHEVPVLVSATPVLENGRFVGTLTAFADITQRKRTEQTLLALNSAAVAVRRATVAQQVFATISHELRQLGLSSGLFRIDLPTGVVRIEHLNYAGKSEESAPVIGSMLRTLFQDTSLATLPLLSRTIWEGHAIYVDQLLLDVLNAIASAGKVWELDVPDHLAGFHAVLAPLISQEQTFGILAVVGEQLTEADVPAVEAFANQTSVALDNARLLADLEAAAIDKTRLYDEMRRAYEDLREMDRIKDEFVSSVSHELRTPLTFVKGYVEYLLEGYAGELNTGQREALSIVLDRSDAVVRLVDDIISLKRAEMDAVDLAPVDLDEVAQACVLGSLAAAGKANVTIDLTVEPGLPPVWGDAKRLGQVFDNLIGNAIKFSPNGGTVTVRLQRLGDEVQSQVSDTGIGIPQEKLDKIWDRFYQVDSTSTRRFAGTGLGLAIVKRIVEAHRGTITVESTLGQGSTFLFTLPVYQAQELHRWLDGRVLPGSETTSLAQP